MRPEHDERFRRIADDYLDRPGGDYAELLRRGQVTSPEGVEPEQWRAEIRAKARADRIRVFTIRSGDVCVAQTSTAASREIKPLKNTSPSTRREREIERFGNTTASRPLGTIYTAAVTQG